MGHPPRLATAFRTYRQARCISRAKHAGQEKFFLLVKSATAQITGMKPHGQTADQNNLITSQPSRIFWRRAILLGLLVWLMPFLVALTAFPLKESWRTLFESIMPLTLAATVVGCTCWYLRRPGDFLIREGILVGLIWMLISVAIDLPLMLSPPISYTFGEYLADIGLTYVTIPILTSGMALAAGRKSR
jgi:hypothetical protein